MAQFQIGSKVIETNSGKHGTVVGVDPYRRGRQTYKVTFEKGEVETKLEADLHADFDLSDPFERCKSQMSNSWLPQASGNESATKDGRRWYILASSPQIGIRDLALPIGATSGAISIPLFTYSGLYVK